MCAAQLGRTACGRLGHPSAGSAQAPTHTVVASAEDATPLDPPAEDAGETGEEAGDMTTAIQPPPVTDVTPTPTITPEVDAEG